MALWREITDEERRTWPATRFTTINAVPVERCEHGKIDPHKTQDSYLNFAGRFVPAEWCGGSPTLREADDE